MHKLLLLIFFIFLSCTTNFYNGITSSNVNFILMVINDLSNKKEYEEVILLYKKLIPLVGLDKKLLFYTKYKLAETNFKLKNYSLASLQLKEIYTKFKTNRESEHVLYLCGLSSYKECKLLNLDIVKMLKAINVMQYFINLYPNSNKIIYANKIVQELNQQLEKKSYYSALFLYKINKYESAVVAFINMLIEFPNSNIKEDVYYYIILSKYNIIRTSILNLETQKIIDIQMFINFFLEQFPNSRFKDKIDKIKIKISHLLVN